MHRCFLHRTQAQFQAAGKRIRELEQQQDRAVQEACRKDQALQLKEAELLAAKQNVRSAVAEHMKSTPASEWRVTSHHHSCIYVRTWNAHRPRVHTLYVFLAVRPEHSSCGQLELTNCTPLACL